MWGRKKVQETEPKITYYGVAFTRYLLDELVKLGRLGVEKHCDVVVSAETYSLAVDYASFDNGCLSMGEYEIHIHAGLVDDDKFFEVIDV